MVRLYLKDLFLELKSITTTVFELNAMSRRILDTYSRQKCLNDAKLTVREHEANFPVS